MLIKSLRVFLTLRSGGDPKAQACKSVDMAFKKFPKGMYSEIKYDGERVQLHKRGKEFAYFSRSLKPVMAHKVKIFKEYIPEAFPDGSDLILDAEVFIKAQDSKMQRLVFLFLIASTITEKISWINPFMIEESFYISTHGRSWELYKVFRNEGH
ncbi:LIG3 [Lepeophtheirus salmonis]|uniref:LIG3 n=1 Tax=Lepeophtheirus salmonis TaxID=72036 RepID=A0A7R8CMN1_LEPSM|nr:LIG3 [Lepeophtheirus salmonis]CAF2865838.1 LIG3 [Lepeophtheirus salmonis]